MLDHGANLLYRRPELCELVYPEHDFSTPRFCRAMFQEHLGRDPRSILDVGCGIGRDLAKLEEWCGAECVGMDGQAQMIDYARRIRPRVRWTVGDMRDFRLGRWFEAIISLGGVIQYALTEDDLEATLGTYSAHACAGTILVLDLPNAAAFLPGGQAKIDRELTIDTPEFCARAKVHYASDRARQLFTRQRSWTPADGSTENDFCQYRMLFPAELSHRLRLYAFHVVAMFDNKDLRVTD